MPAADLARRTDLTLIAPEATKRAEAMEAVRDGATEIDMLLNIGWPLDGQSDAGADEIHAVRDAVGAAVILKVIIEAALLAHDSERAAGPWEES